MTSVVAFTFTSKSSLRNSCFVEHTVLNKELNNVPNLLSSRGKKERKSSTTMMVSSRPSRLSPQKKKNRMSKSSGHQSIRRKTKLQSNEIIIFPNDKSKRGNILPRMMKKTLSQSTKNVSDYPYILPSKNNNGTKIEQPTISQTAIMTKLVAFAIPISVLLTLATNTNDPTSAVANSVSAATAASKEIDFVIFEIEENIEKLESLGTNILDAALPQDATDLFSIALGESLAGLLGALSTWSINMSIMGMMGKNMQKRDQSVDDMTISNESKNLETSKMDNIITEAVADGDYFLTRAAATPLISSVGMSSGLASALTVLLASVPYELIKLNARAREQRRVKEDLYLNALLEEETMKKKQWFGLGEVFMRNNDQTLTQKDKENAIKEKKQKMKKYVNGNEGPMEMNDQFDSIELFADVCKWLEYDVLKTDFGGQLIATNAGLESAIFGGLAALSSQIYADIVYTFSDDMGLRSKRDEVRGRSIEEFFRLYSTKIVSAATLFGVYESAKAPITQIIINFLSGGYESCVGSKDFDLCLETYFFSNPAEATPEAQLRSFAVAFMDLFDRLAGDVSNENVDAAGLIRSLSVQLYSIIGFEMPSFYEVVK